MGNINTRQTTYWEIEEAGECKRINFHGKEEFFYIEAEFNSLEILDHHPVLIDYQWPWSIVFLSAPVEESSELAELLKNAVRSVFGSWRGKNEYFNRSINLKSLLSEGYGMLLEAPNPVIEEVVSILKMHNVRYSALPAQGPRWPRQVMVAGKNYVVAKSFRVEACA